MITWEELDTYCHSCQKCQLAKTRTNVVVGVGNKSADIMLVGEGPGYHEDMEGIPFVGAAGQLLDKMLAAISLSREDVYICNVVKCRPPQNRDPLPEEQKACLDYLRCQYLLVRPKILVCLGRIAAKALIDPEFRITRQRGIWYNKKGCNFIATYHPSALLRDPAKKSEAWEDLKLIKQKLDELRNNTNE
jgi:DNA polymerase